MNKLAIKDYDALLFNKNEINKSLFIETFLPYIYKYANYIYENNKELFSAYYSLEDLISDGVIIAIEKYDYFTPGDSLHPFCAFIDIFCKELYKMLKNTYFMKVCYHTFEKINNVSKARREYICENGVIPDSKTLKELSGEKISTIKKANELVSIEDYPFENYEMENQLLTKILINKMGIDIYKKVCRNLREFDNRDQAVISLVLNLSGNEDLSYSEIGKRYNISRERVRQICNEFYEKFKNDYPDTKKYLKEL